MRIEIEISPQAEMQDAAGRRTQTTNGGDVACSSPSPRALDRIDRALQQVAAEMSSRRNLLCLGMPQRRRLHRLVAVQHQTCLTAAAAAAAAASTSAIADDRR